LRPLPQVQTPAVAPRDVREVLDELVSLVRSQGGRAGAPNATDHLEDIKTNLTLMGDALLFMMRQQPAEAGAAGAGNRSLPPQWPYLDLMLADQVPAALRFSKFRRPLDWKHLVEIYKRESMQRPVPERGASSEVTRSWRRTGVNDLHTSCNFRDR
jgi:hypothetical protein